VILNGVGLSGLDTRVTAYLTDEVVKANTTANGVIATYAVDPEVFASENFTENP